MKAWLSQLVRRPPNRSAATPDNGLADRAAEARTRTAPPFYYLGKAASVIADARGMPWFDERAAATVATAEGFLRHEFDLLGSGVYRPVDPERNGSREAGGYQPIDWALDPVRGLRFPNTVPHRDWRLYDMRPGNADIKYPWELARCQHWATLAQAWLLTGDARFAGEIVAELHDFREANPVEIGVNWTCTMDVAIRALNWALALDAIRHSAALSDDDWQTAMAALREHGAFIFGNFENTYEVTSNHYLSNIVGLFYLSFLFADDADGADWNRFCRSEIEKELETQILPDGADFESSIPYHRLVTELFLGAAALAEHMGEPFSDSLRARLSQMLAYFANCLRPDGRFPQIGDADDGRLHILTRCGGWEPQSGRHLLASGGRFLDRRDWIAAAGADGAWEALWWGYEPDNAAADSPALPDAAMLAEHAGTAVFRRGGAYLAVSNGPVGTDGFGNHKHNDQLGFELFLDGAPLISDPGSFVYTSDFLARNRFRSTAAHSTVMVDGIEQNETDPEMIFRMFDSGPPEHLAFAAEAEPLRYAGRHVGYRRLDRPVRHARLFHFYPSDSLLLLADRLDGEGVHELVWTFACAAGVETPVCSGSAVWLKRGDRLYALASLDDLPARIAAAQQSPSYGVALDSSSVRFAERVDLAGPATRFFLIAPARELEEERLEARIAVAERDLEECCAS